MKTNCSSIRKATRKTNVLRFWRAANCRCRAALKSVAPEQTADRAANNLQERFMEIGLSEELINDGTAGD